MTMFRQGDVLIRRIDFLPKGLKKARGRKILAEGEVTGHVHEVVGEAELFLPADVDDLERRFLHIEATQKFEVPIYETRVTGYATERVVFDSGEVQEIGDPITETVQVGTETVAGAQVVHAEHDTITLPPGAYESWRQCEYTPEAPRVAGD